MNWRLVFGPTYQKARFPQETLQIISKELPSFHWFSNGLDRPDKSMPICTSEEDSCLKRQMDDQSGAVVSQMYIFRSRSVLVCQIQSICVQLFACYPRKTSNHHRSLADLNTEAVFPHLWSDRSLRAPTLWTKHRPSFELLDPRIVNGFSVEMEDQGVRQTDVERFEIDMDRLSQGRTRLNDVDRRKKEWLGTKFGGVISIHHFLLLKWRNRGIGITRDTNFEGIFWKCAKVQFVAGLIE